MKDRLQIIDEIDRQIIAATQDGLPLVSDPYSAVAEAMDIEGVNGDEVIRRMRAMLDSGAVRRIGVVPNHYALGMRANGMSVWDVDETQIVELGRMIGALDFVSHCYQRPRHPPIWPYTLFAMVHGETRTQVEDKVGMIATLLGSSSRGHEILYSTRILKKTGLRVAA